MISNSSSHSSSWVRIRTGGKILHFQNFILFQNMYRQLEYKLSQLARCAKILTFRLKSSNCSLVLHSNIDRPTFTNEKQDTQLKKCHTIVLNNFRDHNLFKQIYFSGLIVRKNYLCSANLRISKPFNLQLLFSSVLWYCSEQQHRAEPDWGDGIKRFL